MMSDFRELLLVTAVAALGVSSIMRAAGSSWEVAFFGGIGVGCATFLVFFISGLPE